MTKIRNISFLLMLVSLVVFVLALVSNPFSIPFQDFEQMPETQQERYVRDAQLLDKIILFSLLSTAGTASVFALSSYSIYKLRNKSESN